MQYIFTHKTAWVENVLFFFFFVLSQMFKQVKSSSKESIVWEESCLTFGVFSRARRQLGRCTLHTQQQLLAMVVLLGTLSPCLGISHSESGVPFWKKMQYKFQTRSCKVPHHISARLEIYLREGKISWPENLIALISLSFALCILSVLAFTVLQGN